MSNTIIGKDTVTIDGKVISLEQYYRWRRNQVWRRKHIWYPLARLLDKLPFTCWAGLYAWSMRPQDMRWLFGYALREAKQCRACNGCYCGKFPHRERER